MKKDLFLKKMKPVMTLRSLPSLMRGWQLESLSGIGALNFREDIDVPILTTPNDVLVKVEASSVNPLDVMMTKGWFGRQFLWKYELCDISTVYVSFSALFPSVSTCQQWEQPKNFGATIFKGQLGYLAQHMNS